MQNKKKRNIIISTIFAISLLSLVYISYLYLNSYIETSEIILPTDDFKIEVEIEYQNTLITENVEINQENYKEIIEKLNRPEEYSFTVSNVLYAFFEEKTEVSTISVTKNETNIKHQDKSFIIKGNSVEVIENSQEKIFDIGVFSNDELMRIPSYEDILQTKATNVYVEDTQTEKVISVETYDDLLDIKEIYKVSLSSGMLIKYEVYEDENLVRQVEIKDLVIT